MAMLIKTELSSGTYSFTRNFLLPKYYRTFSIKVPRPVMMHDFTITTHYGIIMDLPLVFDKQELVKSFPFVFRPSCGARFGIFDRYSETSEGIKWCVA